MFGCKGLYHDGIGHVVVGNHNVLVATLCVDRETLSVICAELSEQEFAEMDFQCQWGVTWCRVSFQLWLGGSDIMTAGLGHMAFDGGVGTCAVFAVSMKVSPGHDV